MPNINLDLSEAISNKPIDSGVYEMEVESVSEAKQGAKAAYVTIVWKCVEEPFVGRKVFDNRPINGRGASIFVQAWNAVMHQDLDVDALSTVEIDTDDMIGERGLISIRHREYNGEIQHEVAKVSRTN